MKSNKTRLLLCTAFGSALLATSALAQEEGDDLSIEEILVTAQKRSETLQEVPIAISVFSSKSIDQTGIQELRELADYIPNVTITQNTDFGAQINIRGVGANSRNIGFDSRVGVYLDGVYLGQGPATNQDLVDLEQVEILRGPQGTLFGKNTVAGAVNMISVKPKQEFEGRVTANVFNYDGREFQAMVNFPMGDVVSARISVSDRERDGFIENVYQASDVPSTFYFPHPQAGIIPLPFPLPVPFCSAMLGVPVTPPGLCSAMGPDTPPNTKTLYNDVNTQSYRAQLRIRPNAKLDINIAVDGLESDRIMINGEPFTDTFGSTVDRFAPEPLEVSFSEDSWETRDIFGANLNIDYDLDNGYHFRSITAYRDTEMVHHNDTDASAIDFLYVDYTDAYEQTTQEFQWISPDNADFKYVAGFYYYNQDSLSIRDAVTGNAGWLFGAFKPVGGAYSDGTVETDSWALFLNTSYDFNERWNLGVGFRYSDETKDVDWNLDGRFSGVFGIGNTPPGGYIDSDTYTNFAPMISIGYKWGENTNVYAKYSTGFKSGGFNLDYVTQDDLDAGITFDEETVDSFEVGLKSIFMDGRFQLNLAAFISNYEDYQVNQFFDLGFDEQTGAQLTSIRITNAAEVDTSGFELEATFNATANLTLYATLGLLDATFADFPGGTSTDVPVEGGDPIRVPVNAKGNDLPLAPSATGTIGFMHYTRFSSVDLLIRADVIYTGDYFTTIENETERHLTGLAPTTLLLDLPVYGIPHTIPYGHVDDYTTINGRIGLIANSGKWEIYLWGRNLTDENTYIDYFRDFFGSLSAVPLLPRTYGLEATWNF